MERVSQERGRPMNRSAVLGSVVTLLALAGVGVFAQRADQRADAALVPPATDGDHVSAGSASSSGVKLAAPRPLLAASARDPFMPPPPPAPPPVEVAAPPPSPPPPIVPPFPYRVLGRILEPDGTRRVYLALEDRLVAIQPGSDLEQGFRVESVGEDEVVVKHGPSGQAVKITWPKDGQ